MNVLTERNEELGSMSLMEHLEELRNRITRSLVAFTLTFAGCWAFAPQIYEFLAQPIYKHLAPGKKLVFLALTDPFFLYMKVAALAGIFAASPIILYQAWAFVAPGLYSRERHMVAPFVFFGSLLFMGGGAFAYYVAFPFAVEFLLGMGQQFEAQITVTRYLGFLMTVILGLGLMFELPTLIFLLTRMGLVTPAFLLRHFRWAVIIIFIVAAVITPTPDIFNLCLFALPTILLYLVGVAVAWVFGPEITKQQRRRVFVWTLVVFVLVLVVLGWRFADRLSPAWRLGPWSTGEEPAGEEPAGEEPADEEPVDAPP